MGYDYKTNKKKKKEFLVDWLMMTQILNGYSEPTIKSITKQRSKNGI